MCIICNLISDDPHRQIDIANSFLQNFEQARKAMKAAADSMLEVSQNAATPEHCKHYDMIHKEMARQCREWSKLEQKREHRP